jgi:hypothetical protein
MFFYLLFHCAYPASNAFGVVGELMEVVAPSKEGVLAF